MPESEKQLPDEFSRSQRKRDAHAVHDLGVKLTTLAPTQLAKLDLPDSLLEAINEFKRIKTNGAKRRQLQFIAKQMRELDCSIIETALQKILKR